MDRRGTPAERYAVGLSIDYGLRALHRYVDVFQGDIVDAVIALAITRANTQHLLRTKDFLQLLERGTVSDEERRPVSVKSIADFLNMPYETARRRVNGLVHKGLCKKIVGGVIVPAAVIGSKATQEAVSKNYADLARFAGDLKRAGFII